MIDTIGYMSKIRSNKKAILIFFWFFLQLPCFSQNVGINSTSALPNPNSILDVDASSNNPKGVLIPRMTTTERDAIGLIIPESLLIYNTTSQCFEAYNATTSAWVSFGCIGCQLPGVFAATAGSNVTPTSFNANWSVSTGATGYLLDVSTSSAFTTFVAGFANFDVSNVTTYSVTGLTVGTIYYYRVRAYNSCGTTISSNTITVIIPLPPLSAGCNTNQTETDYGTVVTTLSGASQTWITRNLGATVEASSASDNSDAAAGCYFQFNRSQAYGFDNGGAVNPAWTINNINENSDWIAGNDPCTIQLGGFWRILTFTEWLNTDANGAWNTYTDTYASVLKIHAAGDLHPADGSLSSCGVIGYYWSSTQSDATNGWYLVLNSVNSNMTNDNKAYGFSVRCLK